MEKLPTTPKNLKYGGILLGFHKCCAPLPILFGPPVYLEHRSIHAYWQVLDSLKETYLFFFLFSLL